MPIEPRWRLAVLHKTIKFKAWKEEQLALQDYSCFYCGDKFVRLMNRFYYEVDHVMPRSRGGMAVPDNLVLACSSCNASKGNKLLSEWAGYGKQ